MYEYIKSKDAIEAILNSPTKIVEKENIPASESEFTYSNGIKSWVGALFVDIVKVQTKGSGKNFKYVARQTFLCPRRGLGRGMVKQNRAKNC